MILNFWTAVYVCGIYFILLSISATDPMRNKHKQSFIPGLQPPALFSETRLSWIMVYKHLTKNKTPSLSVNKTSLHFLIRNTKQGEKIYSEKCFCSETDLLLLMRREFFVCPSLSYGCFSQNSPGGIKTTQVNLKAKDWKNISLRKM